ncbi:MAG: hypothetical protein ACOYN3_09920 [Acidimicrobiia bacterium]
MPIHLIRTPIRQQLVVLACIVTLAITSGACGNAKSIRNAQCPNGNWRLTQESLGALLGSDAAQDPKNVAVSGTVTLTLSNQTASYEFDNVVLAGIAQNAPQKVGLSGVINTNPVRTGTALDTTVTNNSLIIKLNDVPAGEAFTAFASRSIERNLTGAATYSCDATHLTINDTDSGTITKWSASAPQTR